MQILQIFYFTVFVLALQSVLACAVLLEISTIQFEDVYGRKPVVALLRKRLR